MTATIALPRQPHSDWLARIRTIGLGLGGRGVMGLGLGRSSVSAVAQNGLLNNLVAYWPLNEPAGANNAFDVHTAALHATQSGSPGAAAGLVYATARTFNGSTQYFTCASEPALTFGDTDFTVAAWVYLSATWLKWIAAKWGGAALGYEWALVNAATGYFRFFVRNSTNTASVQPSAFSFGLTPLNTWCLVIGAHDAVNDLVSIQVNTTMGEQLALAGGPMTTAEPVRIGASGLAGNYWNGRIGPVAIWQSEPGGGGVLTADQRSALYNAGAGLAYAAFTT